MRNNGIRVLMGVAVTVVVAIWIPIIFGDLDSDPWTKWVYNYQALISAVFAIGAALITVNTMRETDDKQEKRHQELMSLNLRRERMIVDRAAHPQLQEISDIRALIDEKLNKTTSFQDVKIMLRAFREFLRRKQIRDVEEILSPVGYRSIQQIIGTIEQTEFLIDEYTKAISSENPDDEEYMFIINAKLQVRTNLQFISSSFLQLSRAIEDLVSEFRL